MMKDNHVRPESYDGGHMEKDFIFEESKSHISCRFV